MKFKVPLLLASLLMVVGCASKGGNSIDSTASSSNAPESSEVSSNPESSNASSANSSQSSAKPSSTSSKINIGGSSTSQGGNSSRPNSSQGGNTGSSLNSTIKDPETGEEIDLNGYIEVAQAPEGVVLTDWTDEMKGIFTKYLYFQIPPFIWLDGLTVSFDNMGILQVKGRYSQAGVANRYADALTKAGYMAAVEQEGGVSRVYGRGIGKGFMISVDGLEAKNGIFSINFDYDLADSEWPADGIAQEFAAEYYQGTKTVVPPYVYDNPQYYASGNGFGEIDILCLGAPATCVEDYTKVLEANHWTTAPMDNGAYTALSRDKLVQMVYYFDGTGLQIIIGFGPGESSKTWEDCIPAINDFGRTELRLNKDIADEILPIDDAELYEIDRSVRGALDIKAYRRSAYKAQDIFDYGMKMQATGKFTFTVKGDDYWILANDKSYALRLYLEDYVEDTIETTTIDIVVSDYIIYEGGYVFYGQWPTAVIQTITNSINSSFNVPAYLDENATYYITRDFDAKTVDLKIVNAASNALEVYKKTLQDYSFTLSNVTANGYDAIDRGENGKVSVTKDGDVIKIAISKYIKPVVNNGTAKFNFKNQSQLASKTGYTSASWICGNVTFKVEKDNTYYSVGNDGDYLSNPLRIYKDQRITITCSDANITRLDFYINNSNGRTTIADFDEAYLKNANITGATFDTYNPETGLVRFNVNPGAKEISFIATTSISSTRSGFGLDSLDVIYS